MITGRLPSPVEERIRCVDMNISFFVTAAQILAREKDVTRRAGWKKLRPGQVLCAVRKTQGLKKGEKVERLCHIRVISVNREPLSDIIARPYRMSDVSEVEREGFPHMSPESFVEMLCELDNLKPSDEITRIEFSYL